MINDIEIKLTIDDKSISNFARCLLSIGLNLYDIIKTMTNNA